MQWLGQRRRGVGAKVLVVLFTRRVWERGVLDGNVLGRESQSETKDVWMRAEQGRLAVSCGRCLSALYHSWVTVGVS